MSTAIETDNLSKCYRIQPGEAKARYHTLRETVMEAMQLPFRRWWGPGSRRKTVDFWALRDVSFKVEPGEVVGIIGRNGAGKSTLLKILARITEPTTGRALLRGRVGSLLEVGTGFHPELSGRENIYLSGSILGMKRAEIRRKLPDIVEFSGVEAFLETPIKRYSSGMHVRLAFAVAAHLDPQILLIDEVLAVGDIAFQKKCLGKMDEAAQAGKTIFFVSHNLSIIGDLCSRCLHLAQGRIVDDGDTRRVIKGYLQEEEKVGHVDLRHWRGDRRGDGPMRLRWLQTEDAQGRVAATFAYRQPIVFRLAITVPRPQECILGVSVRDASGHVILHPNNTDDGAALKLVAPETEVTIRLPENPLNDGVYSISVWLSDGLNVLHDRVGDCLALKVTSPDDGHIRCRGAVRTPAEWEVAAVPSSV